MGEKKRGIIVLSPTPPLHYSTIYQKKKQTIQERSTLDIKVLATRPAVSDLFTNTTPRTHYHHHYHHEKSRSAQTGRRPPVSETSQSQSHHGHSRKASVGPVTHETTRRGHSSHVKMSSGKDREREREREREGDVHNMSGRTDADEEQVLVPRRYLENVYQNTAMSRTFWQRKEKEKGSSRHHHSMES